jgi:BA14K-like protein
MEFVMTGRSMFLASALIAVGGVWAGSASAAPIHADMSLQGGGLVEQVQHRSGGGGGHGPGISGGRSGGAMSFGRSSGPGMSFSGNGGRNFSGNRTIGGGNFAASNRQSFAATNRTGNWARGNWSGRRNFSDFRRHRGFRGTAFAFGFGPTYYDYSYDYGYYPYDDDAYAYVAPGDDSAGYCAQRYRSYDPSTGTYLGYDGLRHPCP